jgi:cell division control protein 12
MYHVFCVRHESHVAVGTCQIHVSLSRCKIPTYTPPVGSDPELIDIPSAELMKSIIDTMPFAIISSTEDVITADGRTVKGREYVWGVAEGT